MVLFINRTIDSIALSIQALCLIAVTMLTIWITLSPIPRTNPIILIATLKIALALTVLWLDSKLVTRLFRRITFYRLHRSMVRTLKEGDRFEFNYADGGVITFGYYDGEYFISHPIDANRLIVAYVSALGISFEEHLHEYEPVIKWVDGIVFELSEKVSCYSRPTGMDNPGAFMYSMAGALKRARRV